MGQSYRIRTELGVNKTINVQLDQEFEQLEILSLKIQQEDVYIRSCADYGVIVGRVTANNGFGLPNARVSIFIPITTVDESNPIISSIYPYKSPTDKNEDGYRYNLLPYEKSYSTHAATGTIPSRLDVLTGTTAVEIYDRYYKFTAKTNDSGDYMIMGVPLGFQTVVMDVDLSDIGEFSLTPQDLIRMGLATEAQVAGNRFRTSTDLNSLPQIINLVKGIEISPLWGDPEICDIAINRLDFDLRDNANVNIQPTSVFMGSIYSTSDAYRVRRNAKPKDDMGNLCSLQSGPGQILAIRQTIQQDTTGNPILEQYQLEQAGNIIDGDGVWLTELPMNLDYYITNEFGEKVISNDPTIGIPTKAKYRFKIKWTQPTALTEQTRRPYFLVPNVREYGWSNTIIDPNYLSTSSSEGKKLAGSYYFGLDWTGYTNTTAAINCDDTFYQFEFNKVYTVSGLIDEFKNGTKGRFIGIKEIESQDCDSTINKFPVNEGFRNFDLIYFLFSIIFQVIQIIGIPLLTSYHVIAYLWNNFAVPLIIALSAWILKNIIELWITSASLFASSAVLPFLLPAAQTTALQALGWTVLGVFIGTLLFKFRFRKFNRFKLPMITYPDCQACECSPETSSDSSSSVPTSSLVSQLSNPSFYYDNLVAYQESISTIPPDNENYFTYNSTDAIMKSQAIGGFTGQEKNPTRFKTGVSEIATFPDGTRKFAVSRTIMPGERINIYNTRNKYFQGVNKIKVTFASDINNSNGLYHYDNTLTIVSPGEFPVGALLTFVNPEQTKDKNYLWSGTTSVGKALLRGINGKIQTDQFVSQVYYANPTDNTQTTNLSTLYTIPSATTQCVDSITISATTIGTVQYYNCSSVSVIYSAGTLGVHTITDTNCINLSNLGGTAEYIVINSGDTCQRYIYPSDIEYYQVLTAITITTNIVNGVPQYSIPNLGTGISIWNTLNSANEIQSYKEVKGTLGTKGWLEEAPAENLPTSLFSDFSSQTILILQRGVDPYSPLLTNQYGIGKILGHANEDDVIITGQTRMNIPIQKLPTGSLTTVQQHNQQDNIYFPSYVYTPGFTGSTTPGLQFSAYSTSNVGYYGALDSITPDRKIAYKVGNNTYYGFSSGVINKSPSYGIAKGVSSKINNINVYYDSSVSIGKYDSAEDLSGGAIFTLKPLVLNTIIISIPTYLAYDSPPVSTYFSPILYPTLTGTSALNITNYSKNVMRTDRLPSSDYIDSGDLNGNASLLQENIGFSAYVISGPENGDTSIGFSTGASQVTQDIEGQLASENVLKTLSTCENMVGLTCYSGNGVTFGVNTGCQGTDTVENGCYVFMDEPLIDLQKDINSFAEWGYRFRFFYGLCRGVLSQTFTNNWVNGSLFTFPIQVDTYFDKQNKPLPPEFAKELVYFDDKTNNFYYRSSPYFSGATSQRFIGRPTTGLISPVNRRNLLFPTTIINLGIKDDFYQEIIFDPSAKGYIMNTLNPTSYSDTSDLVNLFVISRITDEGFLSQLIPTGNNGLNQLFSRPDRRIDGDLAQSMSINSEYGVIPFSPEYYRVYGNSNDPVVILGGLDNPTMGIFFSSTTVDLQNKDFITPGVIDFRPSNNANAITYPYGIKSQYVPFYQWGLKQPSIQSIFGSQYNDWVTNQSPTISNSGIFGYNYQSLDRRNTGTPSYFIGSDTQVSDIYERGYIFNVKPNGDYSYDGGTYPSKFLVSAPFHFYFGINVGLTALDKFKTKYSVGE